MTEQRATGGRAIAREAVRARLSEAARELIALHGIDATSIEMIANHAGVSYRTFYRHFTSKEDLALAWLDDPGPVFRACLRARPADEPIWTALRHAFDPLLDPDNGFVEQMMLASDLAETSPGLLMRVRARVFDWEAALADVIVERLPEPRRRSQADLLAAWALAALRIALQEWRADGAGSTSALRSCLDDAFDGLVGQLIEPAGAATRSEA